MSEGWDKDHNPFKPGSKEALAARVLELHEENARLRAQFREADQIVQALNAEGLALREKVRWHLDNNGKQEREITDLRAQLAKRDKHYISAVQGRKDFRSALREARAQLAERNRQLADARETAQSLLAWFAAEYPAQRLLLEERFGKLNHALSEPDSTG